MKLFYFILFLFALSSGPKVIAQTTATDTSEYKSYENETIVMNEILIYASHIPLVEAPTLASIYTVQLGGFCGCEPYFGPHYKSPVFEGDSIRSRIAENNPVELNAYPNPTSGIATIEIQNTNGVSIQLFNTDGKLLESYSSKQNKNIIDLGNQPDGTYIVRIIDSSTNIATVKKIVKAF